MCIQVRIYIYVSYPPAGLFRLNNSGRPIVDSNARKLNCFQKL